MPAPVTAVLLLLVSATSLIAEPLWQSKSRLLVRVFDENGIAVSEARVTVQGTGNYPILRCETDFTGRCELSVPSTPIHILQVEKEGFYTVHIKEEQIGKTEQLEVTLNHFQEYQEVVQVTESRRDIDPAATSNPEKLTHQEILNVPYQTTRDFRKVLPFLPGVLQDAGEQIHPAGSATSEVQSQLDGFLISHPVTGLLNTRISVDALRSLQLETSRYSAKHGRGSGGVLALETGMGDDRFRFSATNFIPSAQFREGFSLNAWTPRATFSGPLSKGKAWFFQAAETDYNLHIIRELPPGNNRSSSWRVGSLTKAQVNWNPANILTASFLLNRYRSGHNGLSLFDPMETTQDLRQNSYLFTVKNQTFLSKECILELGTGASLSNHDQRPLGDLSYMIFPGGTAGNHFETSSAQSRRIQWLANLYLPSFSWHGRHQFKAGAGIDHVQYRQYYSRRSISVFRRDKTLIRHVTFPGAPRFQRGNLEIGGYLQDRWWISNRWLWELGLRWDEDRIVRRWMLAPRIATTYTLSADGETKLSMGIGFFYDATRLDMVTRPLAGNRRDQFYAADGVTPAGLPRETFFRVNEAELRTPRIVNWSAGIDRKLPYSIFLHLEFLQKRGQKGPMFVHHSDMYTGEPSELYIFKSQARQKYDSFEITMRHSFKKSYLFLVSYTRSSARSNAVIDFQLDDPIFSDQSGGPLSWDAPHRFLSWGWTPLWKRLDLAYSLEWRNGFPFSLVNQGQRMVGMPNTSRLPAYFSLNLHLERRFQWLRYQWALRLGCNNLTNRPNPSVVDNNIDSPQFLTYGGQQHRNFNARIRFLGRK